jgi:hypothetical protein
MPSFSSYDYGRKLAYRNGIFLILKWTLRLSAFSIDMIIRRIFALDIGLRSN